MKVYEITDNCYKIFINNLILEKFDFSVEKDLEKFLKNTMLSLKSRYKVVLNGLYTVDFFVNEKVGAFVYMYKTDTIFPYKDIDLKIKIVFNCKFYFKTDRYEVLRDIADVYFYEDNYYVDVCNLDNVIGYLELGEFIYNEDFDVENFGIKIN